MSKPFRWDVSRREQLGSLALASPAPAYAEFCSDLRECAARVVAFSRDSDLVFVGRSPESIFDYLSGVLVATGWSRRLSLFNVSIRETSVAEVAAELPAALRAVREHLAELELSPGVLLGRERAVVLVDLVDSGATMQRVTELVLSWAREARVDLAAVRRKLRFLGITWRKKTSPNTFRWQQHAPWLDEFPPESVKNVSIPWRLWNFLGNEQPKVSRTNPPERWAEPEMASAPLPRPTEALSRAAQLLDLGRSRAERSLFSDCLAKLPEVRQPWLRSLIHELRSNAG